jgi:aminopeptidase N
MKKQFSTGLIIISILFITACKTQSEVVDIDEFITLNPIEIKAYTDKDIYRSSRKKDFDIIHTKLEVSFDWDSTFLFGKASILCKPYFYNQSKLVLDAKGFQINEVALLDEIGIKTPLLFSYDSSQITIALGKEYNKQDTLHVFIDYIAMPNKLKVIGSAAITSDKGLYFINPDGKDKNKPKQIWTQGETEASSCWFPTIDSPNEKTTQEIYITVDSNYITLSNGELLFQTENPDGSRTDYWKQNLPHAPYLFMMAIGEFSITRDSWRNKQVNYYVEPQFEDYAKEIFPNTLEMLEFFSTKLDYEYPWDKFDQIVVRDYVSGAMENTSAVIYGEFIQGNNRFLIDNAEEDIVAHELFHHWFGDLVTAESWSNLPLNEAFATYGEYLWNEYKYGIDKAEYHLNNDLKAYLQEARIEQKKLIRFHYLKREDMFDAHSYQKGGRVLHMLRKYIGDEAFFGGLSAYLHKHAFKTAEIHELRLVFEEITGEDLNWFFNQWFLNTGHPEIKVNYEYNDSSKSLNFTVEQIQDRETFSVFEILTNIEVVSVDGKRQIVPIRINKRIQTFTIPMQQAPAFAKLDANNDQLAVIQQDYGINEASALFSFGENYLDRYEAIDLVKSKSDSIYLDIIEKGFSDKFWDIRKTAIENCSKLATLRPIETKKKLNHLAINDPSSKVRAASIEALASHYPDISISELKDALMDSSYLVVSAALESIHYLNADEGVKVAETLTEVKNSDMKASIASIFAEEGKPEYNPFLIKSINESDSYGRYNLAMIYGEYLLKQNDQVITEAFPLLQQISTDKSLWFIRLAGVYSFSDILYKYEEEKDLIYTSIKSESKEAEIKKMNNRIVEVNKVLASIQQILNDLLKIEEDDNVLQVLEQLTK